MADTPQRPSPTAPPLNEPFAAVIAAAQMAMVVTDARAPDNPIVYVNEAFTRLTGYAPADAYGRNCRFMQGPETQTEHVDQLRRAVAEGRDVALDILNYRKDGSPFWNALYISPVRDGAGELVYFFGAQLDATDKKAAELELYRAKSSLEAAVAARTQDLTDMLAQKSALLHEVDHRVKNNLQLIASMMMLQMRRTPEPEARAALRSMLERVSAISTVHRRLFQTEDVERFDVAAFLGDLVDDRGGEHLPAPAELKLEPIAVPAAQAAPLALIVNELLTYAQAGGAPEQLRLSVGRTDGRFVVRAEGGPPREAPDPFGRELVDLLARQLRAETAFADAPDGRSAVLWLPIDAGSI